MPDDPEPKTFPATAKPFVCQDHNKKGCKKVFNHILVVEVGGIRNVLVSGALFESFKFQCQECKGWNYHKYNEDRMEEYNEKLKIILAQLYGETLDSSAIIKSENQTG